MRTDDSLARSFPNLSQPIREVPETGDVPTVASSRHELTLGSLNIGATNGRAKGRRRLAAARAPRPSLDVIAAVRYLLHNFCKPGVRRHSLVMRHLEPLIGSVTADDGEWSRSIADIFRYVLLRLPTRVRAVVERTAFGGEQVREIAKSLNVCERQVYRDRATAVIAIASHLTSSHGRTDYSDARVMDSLDLEFSRVRMLVDVGELVAADVGLSELAREVRRPRDRALIHCALSRLALEQGNTASARSYAERAVSDALESDGDVLARCEIESIHGNLALTNGTPDAACSLLRRSVVGLRSILHGPDQRRACESLAQTLVALSEACLFSGQSTQALDAAEEAQRVFHGVAHPDPSRRLSAQVAAASASVSLGGSLSAAESVLVTCYEGAIAAGCILSALDIAIYLSAFYRFRRENRLALALLNSLLPVSRRVSKCRTKTFFYVTLANALSTQGKARAAGQLLSEAVESTFPNQPDMQAHFYLARARAHLGMGKSRDAIAASMRAEMLFSELGRFALVGVTLHVQSRALRALGRLRDAVLSAQNAVEALSFAGFPQALESARRNLTALRVGR